MQKFECRVSVYTVMDLLSDKFFSLIRVAEFPIFLLPNDSEIVFEIVRVFPVRIIKHFNDISRIRFNTSIFRLLKKRTRNSCWFFFCLHCCVSTSINYHIHLVEKYVEFSKSQFQFRFFISSRSKAVASFLFCSLDIQRYYYYWVIRWQKHALYC